MDLNDKVTQLEDEIKILKNEVQSVLLDLRESFLNHVNPFNPNALYTQAVPTVTPEMLEQLSEEPGPVQVLTEETLVSESEPEIEDGDEEITDGPSFFDDEDDDLPVFGDIHDDETPGFFSDPENQPETTNRMEENMVWHADPQMQTQFKPADIPNPVPSSVPVATPLDLETISELSRWVEESVSRLGPERTRTILDITETMGYMKHELKKIMVKFIHPASDSENLNVTTRDYLASLVELNRLLKMDNRQEVALLSIFILCQEYDNR